MSLFDSGCRQGPPIRIMLSEYCRRVASDEDESKDARLYAGTMIGILTVMPLYSRIDTRQLHSVVEKALQ